MLPATPRHAFEFFGCGLEQSLVGLTLNDVAPDQ